MNKTLHIALFTLLLSVSSMAQAFNGSLGPNGNPVTTTSVVETETDYIFQASGAYEHHAVMLLIGDNQGGPYPMDLGYFGWIQVDMFQPVSIYMGIADSTGFVSMAFAKPVGLPAWAEGMTGYAKTISMAYIVSGNPPQYTPLLEVSKTVNFQLVSASN